MTHDQHPTLFMLWPTGAQPAPAEPEIAAGYAIRTFRPGDQDEFMRLMALTDFDRFDQAKLDYNVARIIPGGWFFAVREATGEVVGTAMCLHNYTGNTPFGGHVGWVYVRPEHTGCRLGYALTACVTRRFLEAGYRRIELGTEHYRLPAIKTYLRLGYRPVLYGPRMPAIWADICAKIGWPYEPERWYARFPPSALEQAGD